MLAVGMQFINLQNSRIVKELIDDYENMENQNDGNYKIINKSKCEEYLTQSIARYFQSDT